MTARVLIADDSLVVRAVIKKQLASEGYEILEVERGAAVLEMCRGNAPPDVVLLDIEMPGMNGYEVLAELQADAVLSGIPVVFLSGRVSAEDVATGLRLGAHDYLRKPVETGELVARVTAALRMKALHDQVRREDVRGAGPAPVDALTGILDVRGLQERLEVLATAAGRSGRPLGGVLIDVDHLDAINATHGWAAGDDVLRRIADVLRARLRGVDVVGRCGPDEFLALLPDTSLSGATTVASSLRQLLSGTPLVAGGAAVELNVSIGAAVTESGSADELVRDLQAAVGTSRNDRAEVPNRRRWLPNGR